jgi:hypothetical protein
VSSLKSIPLASFHAHLPLSYTNPDFYKTLLNFDPSSEFTLKMVAAVFATTLKHLQHLRQHIPKTEVSHENLRTKMK